MKLHRLILSVAFSLSFGPLASAPLASEVNLNQRISSSVSVAAGTGVYTKEKNEAGVEYLKKIYHLPYESSISFSPSSALTRPMVMDDDGNLSKAAGRYFGKLVIERNGASDEEWAVVQEINKKAIFIYEWQIDKRSYLTTLFDLPLDDKSERFEYKEPFAWDAISTKGRWTSVSAQILNSVGRDLIDNAPPDVEDFCPNYSELDNQGRTAFWIHMLNAIMKRESAWDLLVGNDESNYGNGMDVVSRGALQISYESSRAKVYRESGCEAKSAEDLHNFGTNIQCGVAIFAHWIRTDDCISCQDANGKWLGIARYWSTLRESYEVSCKNCSSGKAKIGHKENIIAEVKATQTCSAGN